MALEMTKDWLLERCRAQGLYRTPSLNNSLYLQCQAFCEIQNLDEYTGVTQLHLEENCIESLNGVQPLKQLQCLYLHKNFVRAIDFLEELEDLDTLDLSQNCLSKLDNLRKCSKLRVLVVSHNLLDSVTSIEHLTLCPSIMILDLSHNNLKDGDGVLGVAKSLANLTVLYLSGNPFVAVFPHYRKKVIGVLDKLNHLDDRPVFWDERRYAQAWMRGGQEEENTERDRVREMRATEENLQFEAMRLLRYQAMEERQYVAHRPMLQFTPEELGEDAESLGSPCPDNIEQGSIRRIEVQDGETGPLEEIGLRTLHSPSAQVGESWTEGGPEGQDRGGCYSMYSQVEACYSLEHDLMVAQDEQSWTESGDQGQELKGCSTTYSQAEAGYSMEHDFMVAQDQQSLTEGGDQGQEPGGCNPSHSQVEAGYSKEHDSMVAQDLSQQYKADYSMEHDSTLAQDHNQQGSTVYSQSEEESLSSSESGEGKYAEFCTTSPKMEPNSMQHERMVQIEHERWPADCTWMPQELGAIRLPVWESPSQVTSEMPVENTTKGNNDHRELKPRVDTCQAHEPTDQQGASLQPPQEIGNDSFEWNRYYNNPSFCGGQQCEDNFLLSLQGMNDTAPNSNKGKLNNNPSFSGQQIDDNFLLSMCRINDIEPCCTKGIMRATLSDSNEHERDPETVC